MLKNKQATHPKLYIGKVGHLRGLILELFGWSLQILFRKLT
jgi:hypothetical protein